MLKIQPILCGANVHISLRRNPFCGLLGGRTGWGLDSSSPHPDLCIGAGTSDPLGHVWVDQRVRFLCVCLWARQATDKWVTCCVCCWCETQAWAFLSASLLSISPPYICKIACTCVHTRTNTHRYFNAICSEWLHMKPWELHFVLVAFEDLRQWEHIIGLQPQRFSYNHRFRMLQPQHYGQY